MYLQVPKELEQFYFHNVGAFEHTIGLGENTLVRVPKSIADQLDGNACMVSLDSAGVEVRFVTESSKVDIFVSCLAPRFGNASINVYKGEFLVGEFPCTAQKKEIIRLPIPEAFEASNHALLNKNHGFHSNVWRIMGKNSGLVFHGVDTYGKAIRKPNPEEMPSVKWLAYGSSITQSHAQGYIQLVAKELHLDVQNLGMSGGCLLEEKLIDYMFEYRDFDIMTCELGINARGHMKPAEFEKRSRYLLEQIKKKGCPSLIISVFPNGLSEKYAKDPSKLATQNEMAYNRILENLVQEYQEKKIHFVSGEALFTNISGLSADLLHPTPYGHSNIANNLIKKFQEFHFVDV